MIRRPGCSARTSTSGDRATALTSSTSAAGQPSRAQANASAEGCGYTCRRSGAEAARERRADAVQHRVAAGEHAEAGAVGRRRAHRRAGRWATARVAAARRESGTSASCRCEPTMTSAASTAARAASPSPAQPSAPMPTTTSGRSAHAGSCAAAASRLGICGKAAQCTCRKLACTPAATKPSLRSVPRAASFQAACSAAVQRLDLRVVELVPAHLGARVEPGRRAERGRLAVAERQAARHAGAHGQRAAHRAPVELRREVQQPAALGEHRPARARERRRPRRAAARWRPARRRRPPGSRPPGSARRRPRGAPRRRSGRTAGARRPRPRAARGSPGSGTRTRARARSRCGRRARARRPAPGSRPRPSPAGAARARRSDLVEVDVARGRVAASVASASRARASRSSAGIEAEMALGRGHALVAAQRAEHGHADAGQRVAQELLVVIRADAVEDHAGDLHVGIERAVAVHDRGRRTRHRGGVHDEQHRRVEQLRDVRGRGQLAAPGGAVEEPHDALDDRHVRPGSRRGGRAAPSARARSGTRRGCGPAGPRRARGSSDRCSRGRP